ncbi:MAG: PAS domain S-box protein [Chloroflexi bacterium]|nr:PAS domain S-box protein [Chloroflexota bacterium]
MPFPVELVTGGVFLGGAIFVYIIIHISQNTIVSKQKADETLKESEEKYRILFENAGEAIFVAQDNKVVFVNPMTVTITGYSGEELAPRPFVDFIHADDRDMVRDRHAKRLKGESIPQRYYFRVLHKNGGLLWVQLDTILINWQGKPATLNFMTDITERKKAEEALQAWIKRYDLIVEASGQVAYEYIVSTGHITWGSSIEGVLGYPMEDISGGIVQWQELLHPEDREATLSALDNAEKACTYWDIEYRMRHKRGDYIWIRDRGFFLPDAEGKAYGQLGMMEDITERKRAEDEIKKQTDAMDSAIDGMAILNEDGKYVYLNKAHAKIYGYENEAELIGQSWRILYDSEVVQRFEQEFMPELSRKGYWYGEAIGTKKNGSKFPQAVSLTAIANGGLICIVRDVTERRQLEEERLQTNTLLNSIIENIPDMIFLKDSEELRFVRFNQAGEDLLGYSREDLLGKSDYDLFPKEQADHFTKKDRDVLSGKEVLDIPEENIQTRNKGERILHTKKVPILNAKGEPKYLLGISEDITDRKKAEESLKNSEEKYRLIFENAPLGLITFDEKSVIVACNDFFVKLIGSSKEKLIGYNLLSLPDEKIVAGVKQALQGHIGFYEGEYTSVTAKKTTPGRCTFTPMDVGRGRGGMGIIEDITERKRRDDQLRESEELFRYLFQHHAAVKFIIDPDTGDVLDANEAAVNYYGWSREELTHMKMQEINTLRPEEVKAEMDKARKGKRISFEFRHRRADGSIRDVQVFSSGINMRGKDILHSIVIDITEQKQAENALLESEERYRSLVENAQEGIFQTTPEGRFRMANQAMATILGYDSPRELIESVTDITHQIYVNPEDRIKNLANLDLHGTDLNIELQFYRKDGSVIWVSAQTQSVRDKNGNVICYEGMIQDITDRKNNAEKLKKALGGTVQAIASLAESRDPYTAGHQHRVAELATAIAEEMGLSPEQIEGLTMGCIIHDVGKVSVPADILNIPRKLTAIEFGLVKAHVQSGHDIVKDIEFPWPVARMILEHHERIDGSGYPNGLTGDKLLLESRIMEVADVVEAMASHRPYRTALGIDAALEEIEKNKGIIYDADVVDACLKLFREKGYLLK